MKKPTKPEPAPGIIVVDKPAGWTSHDVVARMRRLAGTSKVGHAGTLDPMATGVLVIGVGKATKLLTYVVGHHKTYDATIRLGQATLTDDAEGEQTSRADASGVTDEAIAAGVARLTGDIMQRPSSVSAIKIKGERAYARVRGGEDVVLPERPVTVVSFAVHAIRREAEVIDVDVTVEVSAGTYVRALARDLGESLGVGGHLTALRRTSVGALGLDVAHTLDELAVMVDAGEPVPLVPLARAAAAVLPFLIVNEPQRRGLSYGKAVDAPEAATHAPGTHVALMGESGALLAIASCLGTALKPVIVFEPAAAPVTAE